MDREIRIAVEGDIIRVTYRGKVEYEPTTRMLRSVGTLAAETGIERLLFDIRAANYRDYHLGTIRHSEEGPGVGIRHSFRIAFLGDATHDMLGYIEAVTSNRGYWSKAFTDETEAVDWLRSRQ